MILRYPKIAIASLLVLVLGHPGAAAIFDHSTFDEILHHYVDDEGYVDYASIRQNSMTALESYFERVAAADLTGWSPDERLAFWINAYNARVIYAIAKKPTLKKISEDFELLNRPFKITGRLLSPNDIVHRILRGTVNKDNRQGPIAGISFKTVNPEIHFGLVCGALSSPKLRPAAYTAENVREALHANSLAFANSDKYISVSDGHLEMSSLLKWYADDFKAAGGISVFILSRILPNHRGDADALKLLLTTANPKTTFRYDWSLNDKRNKVVQADHSAPSAEEIPADALSTSNPDLSR